MTEDAKEEKGHGQLSQRDQCCIELVGDPEEFEAAVDVGKCYVPHVLPKRNFADCRQMMSA